MGEAFPPVAPGAVVAEISMSLDGYVTGPDDRVGHGLDEGGEVLHYWVFGGPWTYGDPTEPPGWSTRSTCTWRPSCSALGSGCSPASAGGSSWSRSARCSRGMRPTCATGWSGSRRAGRAAGGGGGRAAAGSGRAVTVEVGPAHRSRGPAAGWPPAGRRLAAAAPALVPPGEPLWARVAPGNVASVRAFLAAGYRPVGAEVLLS
jgi:hypothetical protein